MFTLIVVPSAVHFNSALLPLSSSKSGKKKIIYNKIKEEVPFTHSPPSNATVLVLGSEAQRKSSGLPLIDPSSQKQQWGNQMKGESVQLCGASF